MLHKEKELKAKKGERSKCLTGKIKKNKFTERMQLILNGFLF